MRRKNNLKIKALEQRRKKIFIPTNSKQNKVTLDYENQNHYPTAARMFANDFQTDFYGDYDDFCNLFDYEDCDEFYDPFNYTCYSDSGTDNDSDSFFFDDEQDKRNSQGFEEVDLEALDEVGDETSGVFLKLPLDIFLDIFSRLPIRSLACCRCVCKTWCKIIHHPRFTSMHHTRAIQVYNNYANDSSTSLLLHDRYSARSSLCSDIYLLDHDIHENSDHVMVVKPRFYPSNFEFEVVGSCNGLLCLSEQFYYDPIYVCNPVIGEYVKIPEISERTNYDIVSGFGYDQVTNEYKVIRMVFDDIDHGNECFKSEAEVYTLGSGMWRKLGDVPYPLRGNRSSAFVNGALHWITDDSIVSDVSELILSFDVSREEFRPVPPPPVFNPGCETCIFGLGDLRRCLCVFDYSSNNQFEIWVMKDYGVKDSWTKKYVISRQELGLDRRSFHPLKMLDNDEMLLVCNDEYLVCYDPKQRSIRELQSHGLPPKFDAITHVGSFVSLRDIIGPTTSSARSANNRRWCRTSYPLPSDNPELYIEDLIDHQLAAFLDSGAALSDLYHDL